MTKRIATLILFLAFNAGGWWLAGPQASPVTTLPVQPMGCCDGRPATNTDPAPTTPPAAPSATLAADEATCPVRGEIHKKADMIAYDYQGKTYYFCCQDCVDKFKADPQKYLKPAAAPAAASTAPAAAAAAPAADEATCPVTGETDKKADMTPYVYKGVTYYFCCPACLPKFKADPEKYIKPAA